MLAGAALIVFGAVSNDSVLRSVGRFVTGQDTDTASWQFLAGGAMVLCGLVVGLWRAKAR